VKKGGATGKREKVLRAGGKAIKYRRLPERKGAECWPRKNLYKKGVDCAGMMTRKNWDRGKKGREVCLCKVAKKGKSQEG